MKGIVFTGGTGSRLHPITLGISKQLAPVYDKPMIYYPLSVLLLAGISDILVISTPTDRPGFQRLLGDGSHLGITVAYAEQPEPRGLADAFIIGADHIGHESVALVLGDNIFHGPGLADVLQRNVYELKGCVLFGYPVADPQRYGVAEVDHDGRLISLQEKPTQPRSNRAVTGLYLYDNDVIDIVHSIKPSVRGELEITDVNQSYIDRGAARLIDLGRGFAWLDTGTYEALLDAAEYVRVIEQRQGLRIGCLEEVAFRMGFIDADQCHELGRNLSKTGYGQYVMRAASEGRRQMSSEFVS